MSVGSTKPVIQRVLRHLDRRRRSLREPHGDRQNSLLKLGLINGERNEFKLLGVLSGIGLVPLEVALRFSSPVARRLGR
jgi:hypothetical protein